MSVSDAALAARVEAWIDSAGCSVGDVMRITRAVLEAGFAPAGVKVMVEHPAGDDASELIREVESVGVGVLAEEAAELNGRLSTTGAELLFLIRKGFVEADLLPKAVGFLDRFSAVDVAYGDSVTVNGLPRLRPPFSPMRLRTNDYLGPVVAARVSALRRLGGFRPEARRAHVLDLVLRAHAEGLVVALDPQIMATEQLTRDDFAETSPSQAAVVAAHLERIGVRASIEALEPFVRRVRYEIEGDPLVSIVIPTRGSSATIAGRDRVLVVEAIRGIIERSTYRNVEFVVVADAETPPETVEALEELCGDRLRMALWDAPFNFSAKMNRGAAVARGDYLLLLNDDVEVVTDDWIESMLGLAQQEGVGIVGAQLYFEDSTVQHAGQIYTGGVAGHAAFGWVGGRDDSIKSMNTDHEVSGVTAACALMARELYFEVGGFTLALPGNYNDVDLNLKIRATGRSAVFSPWARLYHFESKSRDPRILESDLTTLQGRWARRMQVELYSRML
ncbi:glycosyltransferase family 2 protein [Agromyces laixinhei]|uniref:glycosyltransferase family 2 protein n=1 Tax=Agromyces laixinhei TaxID=2585717 RepID=UPI0011167727|nr:glycosyltransferase [Agromyces laixinhei]